MLQLIAINIKDFHRKIMFILVLGLFNTNLHFPKYSQLGSAIKTPKHNFLSKNPKTFWLKLHPLSCIQGRNRGRNKKAETFSKILSIIQQGNLT